MKRYNVTFVTPTLVHIVTVDAFEEDQAIHEAETHMPAEWLADVQETSVEEA